MLLLKTLLLAGLLSAPAAAFELNGISAADIQASSDKAAQPAPMPVFAAATDAKNGLDPVVITVPGLKFGELGWGCFELRNILRFISHFYGNREITEADIVDGVVSFDPRYFFPDEDAHAESAPARLPDNYLELKLQEIPGYADHDVIIIPFKWSRDPGSSKKTVKELQAMIAEVYDSFRDSGRPVYILAHSWGSVLAHTALHRLGKSRPDVRVSRLITAGSPLVPANFVVKLFMRLENKKEGLERNIRKPSVVEEWHNFWSMRDAYSNTIPAADTNFQADAGVENVEPQLIDLILHNKLLKKQARKDLFKIRDIKAWHSSYFFDYKAFLKSLEKEVFVPVFQPALAPQVIDCSSPSAPPVCSIP